VTNVSVCGSPAPLLSSRVERRWDGRCEERDSVVPSVLIEVPHVDASEEHQGAEGTFKHLKLQRCPLCPTHFDLESLWFCIL
jgi:hypothetical protein